MFGYIGSALIFVAMYRLGEKRRDGFLFGLAGEAFWLARGVQTGLTDLIALSAIFAVMHVCNFVKWKYK